MKRHSDNQEIINYLLGALSEAELERFEQRYLEDESVFQELQETEEELIDDYVNGVLTVEQREQFEKYFLSSPERREKLKFAHGLTAHATEWKKKHVASTLMDDTTPDDVPDTSQEVSGWSPVKWFSRPVPAWRQWGALAAALIIALGAGALWIRNRKLERDLVALNENARRSIETANAEHAQAIAQKTSEISSQQDRIAQLQDTLNELQRPGGVASVAIRLGLDYLWDGSKGEGVKKIKSITLPAGTQSMGFTLEFEKTNFQRFKVALRRADQSVVWVSTNNLRATSSGDFQRVVLKVPTNNTTPGDYELVLSGVTSEGDTESVGKYFLKIVRP